MQCTCLWSSAMCWERCLWCHGQDVGPPVCLCCMSQPMWGFVCLFVKTGSQYVTLAGLELTEGCCRPYICGGQTRVPGVLLHHPPLWSFESGSLSEPEACRKPARSSDHLMSTPHTQTSDMSASQPQLEHQLHGTELSTVSLLGTLQLAEPFKCLCCHVPRASWQCGMHVPYSTGGHPRKLALYIDYKS